MSSDVSSRPFEATVTTTMSQNRFSVFSCYAVVSPPGFDEASPASSQVMHDGVHAPHNASLKPDRGMNKRDCCCTQSVESVLPIKITVGVRDCGVSQARSVGEDEEAPIEPTVNPSVPDPVLSCGFPDRNTEKRNPL